MKPLLDYADILISAPCYLGWLWAADKFCKKFLGASKKNELLFIFLSFCGSLFMDIVSRRYAVLYILSLVLNPINPIFFMALVLLLFRSDKEKRILAASMLMMTVRLAGNFCASFLSCLLLFFRHTVKKIPDPLLTEWETGVINGIGYCFVIYAVCWMTKNLEPVFCGRRGRWYAILAIPLLVITIVSDVAGWCASNGIMVRSGGGMGLYYDQIFSHAGFLVLAVLSMSLAGVYVFGMNRIYLEQEKNGRYHAQIAVYKMLAEQHSRSERLRHDMKNHIIALSTLSRNKEWEKMDDYLKNMGGVALDTSEDMTGNRAVDALLYQKRKQAEEKNIKWECDVQMPKEGYVNEFDLCILFGNILDNALEACERLSSGENCFIDICAEPVKKCFLIEVKNSMDRTEKYTEGATNKENVHEHGIGLLNVGDVVNKYNGVVKTEAQKGIFGISILMPFPDTAHDIQTTV